MTALANAIEFDYSDLVTESPDLELFREFASSLTTQQKKPLILESFQELYLGDHFSGCTITVVIQTKKQGKSTIVSAVCLFHALTREDADVIIVAVSKKQADVIYQHMRKFIAKNPELQDLLDVKTGFNEIRVNGSMSRIRILAADDQTLEGVEPTLAVIDEYGQFKTDEVWGPLNEGLDTRQGQMIVLSNAGSDEQGPLGLVRKRCYGYGVYRRAAYRYCKAPDGSEVLHEWALDPSQDCEDLNVVKTASPASWTTVQVLARRRQTTSTLARWLRMSCGIWARGGEAVIQSWEWDALNGMDIEPRSSVFVGLDFAFKTDCTAIAPHQWIDGLRVFGTPIILEPPSDPDKRLDTRAVITAMEVIAGLTRFDRPKFERDLAGDNDPEDIQKWADAIEASKSYSVSAFVYDSYGVEQMIQDFERKHRALRFVHFSQKDANTSRADGRFMEAFRQKLIRHNGDEGMKTHVLNAVETPTFGGREFKFDHPKDRTKFMDALRAASMAHDAAVAEGGTGPAKKVRRVGRFYTT